MRELVILIGLGILISVATLIYNIVQPGNWPVTIANCLMSIIIWLLILIIICRKGKKRDSALVEEMSRHELERQKSDGQLRDMQENVIWLKRQIAHGVRMPLAIISGYGDLLRKGDYRSSEEQILYIDKICRNIDYLNQTFQIVIDDDREKAEKRERLDLIEVAESIIEYTDNLIRSHGVRLELNTRCTQVQVWGNRIDIMKVFYNLIENSLKYMQCGDSIYITIEEVEDQAWIVYRDNGEGVTLQGAEQLTASHYMGEQTEPKPEVIKGTGMGMYLVKDIIQKHHGTLQVKGGSGAGFSMYITIPLLNEEES